MHMLYLCTNNDATNATTITRGGGGSNAMIRYTTPNCNNYSSSYNNSRRQQ